MMKGKELPCGFLSETLSKFLLSDESGIEKEIVEKSKK